MFRCHANSSQNLALLPYIEIIKWCWYSLEINDLDFCFLWRIHDGKKKLTTGFHKRCFFFFLVSLEEANHGTLPYGGLVSFDAQTNGYFGGRTVGRAQGGQSVQLPFGWVALLPASCAARGWAGRPAVPMLPAVLVLQGSGWLKAQLCPSVSLMDGLSLDVGMKAVLADFFFLVLLIYL